MKRLAVRLHFYPPVLSGFEIATEAAGDTPLLLLPNESSKSKETD